MSSSLAESTARLKLLVEQIVKEKDPTKYDKLGSEIWLVRHERDRLRERAGDSEAA